MFKITARTVLELGAELISSDIIAFYELIKNAFDAGSRSGAEIHFWIVLRRNAYLRIRKQASALLNAKSSEQKSFLAHVETDVANALNASAGHERIDNFIESIAEARSIKEFIGKLDEAYRTQNTISVLDTGSGMSLDELETNYLTIGTPSRKRAVDRAIADNDAETPFLGEKGIGRLSAMRLGGSLAVRTAREEDRLVNNLDVDWDAFGNLGAMIDDIDIEPYAKGRKSTAQWHGTTLCIGNLSEDWTEQRVRDMAEYDFARLTDPFKDPKNRPRIALLWNGIRITIPWMNSQLIDAAHAMFKGEYVVTTDGPELRVRLEAKNLGYKHPIEIDTARLTLPDLEGLLQGAREATPQLALEALGPFKFEAYWFNRRYLSTIESIGNQKMVRDLQRKWSGIMLFRDGFRVFPYGDDEDDWLGLDRRALGRSGYVLNKAQFVGRVQITRTRNPGLVDQTNREGLRASPEQQVFVGILQHVVRDMLWDFFKEIDRKYKNNPVDLGDVKQEINTLESRARAALTKVRKLVPKADTEIVDDLQHAFVEFKELAGRAQERIEQVEEDSKQMLQMAGVGLMVEVVAHELARATEAALEAVNGLHGKDLPSDARARLETLKAEMKSVSKRLRVLDEMSVSGRQRSEIFDLGELLADVEEGHASQFKRHGITLKMDKPKGPLRVKLVKGMIVQILENLLSNSVYWMKVKAIRDPRFSPTIRIRVDRDPLTITFSDNGQGIAADHREKIFRPFWSLKEKNKRRGLGLFIARENAQYLDGRLYLSEKTDLSTERLNTFILELPEGSLVK